MFEIIGLLFNLLNKVIPKRNKVVISSFPDYEDMTRGVISQLLETEVIVLLTSANSKAPIWLPAHVKSCPKNSLKGAWHILTSSEIYYTHGLFSFFNKINKSKQVVINMWHGMPLKNIGLLDGKTNVPDSHYLYSTSVFFQDIMARSFGKISEDVLISGLPRNNILTQTVTNPTLNVLKEQYEKIYVWLPTYRKSNVGDVRIDGASSSLYGFDDFDIENLNRIMEEQNTLVIIKPHPMAVVGSYNADLTNVKLINEEWLFINGMTLYELLAASDMLWTDFSSVFVDYLLTKKTILFLIPDFDEYKKNRGLTFDINETKLPGVVFFDENSFIAYLKSNENKKGDRGEQIFNTVETFVLPSTV